LTWYATNSKYVSAFTHASSCVSRTLYVQALLIVGAVILGNSFRRFYVFIHYMTLFKYTLIISFRFYILIRVCLGRGRGLGEYIKRAARTKSLKTSPLDKCRENISYQATTASFYTFSASYSVSSVRSHHTIILYDSYSAGVLTRPAVNSSLPSYAALQSGNGPGTQTHSPELL
jgi:hypothetical protein